MAVITHYSKKNKNAPAPPFRLSPQKTKKRFIIFTINQIKNIPFFLSFFASLFVPSFLSKNSLYPLVIIEYNPPLRLVLYRISPYSDQVVAGLHS
jgi:hypothetical protein